MRRAEQLLTNLLKKNKLTIALAESMTCGLAAHKLGTISGTSEILTGSIVCYSERVKTGLLRIKKLLIEKHTAESQKVTDALALNLSKIITADIHAAITGLAAPGGSESKSKPVGTVFYSIFFKGHLYRMKTKFNGSPLQVKEKACRRFFKFTTRILKSQLKPGTNGS
jgi:nicotinamide-nucleotide amidase